MSDRTHLEPGEFAGLETLASEDPRRRHVETCARCRAGWIAYRRFLAAPDDLPAAEVESARASLHATLRAELNRPAAAAAPSRWSALAAWMSGKWPVPALATAALVALAAGGLYARFGTGRFPSRPEVLREAGPATLEIVPLSPEFRDDGSLALRWRSVPGATGYRVTLLTVALDPLFDGSANDTVLVIEPARFGPSGPGRESRYWQVAADRDGSPVATSPPLALPRP